MMLDTVLRRFSNNNRGSKNSCTSTKARVALSDKCETAASCRHNDQTTKG
jgi:hypothetical protein